MGREIISTAPYLGVVSDGRIQFAGDYLPWSGQHTAVAWGEHAAARLAEQSTRWQG